MPRHDESHVAIPALAGLLLLLGGCAGQMQARHGTMLQGTM